MSRTSSQNFDANQGNSNSLQKLSEAGSKQHTYNKSISDNTSNEGAGSSSKQSNENNLSSNQDDFSINRLQHGVVS